MSLLSIEVTLLRDQEEKALLAIIAVMIVDIGQTHLPKYRVPSHTRRLEVNYQAFPVEE